MGVLKDFDTLPNSHVCVFEVRVWQQTHPGIPCSAEELKSSRSGSAGNGSRGEWFKPIKHFVELRQSPKLLVCVSAWRSVL